MRQVLVLTLILSCAIPLMATDLPLPTVEKVLLDRYLGKWHEIASIPQFFQRKCIKNTTAEYSQTEEGLIQVLNQCIDKDNKTIVANGAAKVVDSNSNAKLKVTFVKIFDWVFSFGGDYWIIDLDNNYTYAVVGHPKRTYAWILSRTPDMAPEVLAQIAERLKRLGYDTCQIMTSLQDGGRDRRQKLCEL